MFMACKRHVRAASLQSPATVMHVFKHPCKSSSWTTASSISPDLVEGVKALADGGLIIVAAPGRLPAHQQALDHHVLGAVKEQDQLRPHNLLLKDLSLQAGGDWSEPVNLQTISQLW